MPKRPARIYDAQFMADAVGAHAQLQAQAMKVAPHAFGPMSRVPLQPMVAAEDVPETLKAHCFTCKSKRGESASEFDVEGEQKMKNGAIRKYGKCKADGCGQTLSMFAAGVKDAA